jgi:hypothetical protein
VTQLKEAIFFQGADLPFRDANIFQNPGIAQASLFSEIQKVFT